MCAKNQFIFRLKLVATAFALGTALSAVPASATDCVSCHNAQPSSSSAAQKSLAGFPLVSYSLDVSENLNVLLHPNDPSAKWMAAWTTFTQLAQERNKPY